MRVMEKRVFFSAVLAIVLGTAGTLRAQTATGQITGTVTDASGAVIPGAKVTVTSQLTGTSRETATSESGNYAVPFLPVSVYSVSVEKQGFRLAKSTDIQLNVADVIRVDLELAVGELTQTVEVRAATVSIETETAAISNLVSQRQVVDLPLNGRNFLQLLFLSAGAVETHGEQGDMRKGQGDAISINGSRPTSNNYMLDGTSITDTALNTSSVILSVDAIQEFKEQTSNYSAEYGFSANQINIVSKSGTNQLHGSVFEFLRNDSLDARSYFQQNIPPLRQNQFGFVAGGPVYIPGAYDGRNKTFWLVNYEGNRTQEGYDRFGVVPLPDELNGNFMTQIIDPVTGLPFPGSGNFVSVIPQNRFSRVAKLAVAKFFPAPNVNLPQGNYRDTGSVGTDTNQVTFRVDQNLGHFGTIFGRGTFTDFNNTSFGTLSGVIGNRYFVQKSRSYQGAHAWPISPTMVNQFRVGYLHADTHANGFAADQADVDALQLTGVFTDLNDLQRVYPFVAFSGTRGLGVVGGAVNAYNVSTQPMWDVSNTTTLIRGSHTLTFGANYRRWWQLRDISSNFLGGFDFNGAFSGDPVADMLLGYYSNISNVFQPATFSVPGEAGNPREFNFHYFAPYIQDDWKVTPRFTLNLGLRWDFRTLPYETNDRAGWTDYDNPLGGLLVADRRLVDEGIIDASGYYKFAGRRTPKDSSKTVFAPRFGFAYRPFGNKTVIRGGYGVFFDSAEQREYDGPADIYPYVSNGAYSQSVGQAAPLQTTDALFPDFSDFGVVTPAANSFLVIRYSKLVRNPYVQQWSLSVGRTLSPTMTFEVNYLGNKGTHLLMRRNIAQSLPPSDPAFCSDELNVGLGDCPVMARRPLPNFNVNIDADWSGNSSYNSFNAKFERRTGSMVITTIYTWAKSLDNKSAAAGIGNDLAGWQGFLDNHDVKRDRGRSEFDVNHRFVSSFLYSLPVGRGKQYLGSIGKGADLVVGGWQVNGIVTFQRGFPYGVYSPDVGGLLDSFGTNRADLVGDPNPGGFQPTLAKWFNTDAFATPGQAFFGNSGRNIMRAPGLNNWDMSVFKNFSITERVAVQFRLESFNAWNHSQWQLPEHNTASPQNGQIISARPGRINQLGLKILW